MPVDFGVIILPILTLAAAGAAIVSKRHTKKWASISAASVLAMFVIYFLPGWWFWLGARKGDAESQYMLGVYYWTRLGYMWSDPANRDKWWLRAASQGHPEAMFQVGYHSMHGSSKYIPKNFDTASFWLEKARDAGNVDAIEGLKTLHKRLQWLESEGKRGDRERKGGEHRELLEE